MTTGAKIGLVVAVAVVGVMVIGVILTGAGALFWMSSRVQHQQQAACDAVAARTQAEAARVARARTAFARAEAAEAAPASPPPADEKPAEGTPDVASKGALAQQREKAIDQGTAYLVSQQAENGSWGDGNVGITALCAQALLEAGKTIQDPPVRKAVDFIVTYQQDDGGIYDQGLRTYTTSIALMVLVRADPKTYAQTIEKAKAYLIQHQWDEAESIDKANPWYGGHGYGKHQRPDLSNTQYFVEAMHEAGVPKDHPLWDKVVTFVSRSQDRSESNDGMFVGSDSGGMIYSPHAGGESKAGTVVLPDGRKGLKAYGSMTYAGFKSFIYAHLDRDDPRVQAAIDWIRRHWTFEENPELGQQGLFYYYQTAAKALAAWGEDTITDARRRPHDWKAELTQAIARRQKPDGSWVNEADRWFEGYPPVPTSYALIALAQCR